jgi:hypothetical protein
MITSSSFCTMTEEHKVHMAPQGVALIKLIIFAVGLGAGLTVLILWAKSDAESEIAQQVRDIIGLADPVVVVVVEVVAKPMSLSLPPSVVVVVPSPIVTEVPAPSTTEMSFRDFVDDIRMWPHSLELTLETSVPIIYRGNNFGQMRFVPGKTIQVESILHSSEIIGSVDGNFLTIPVGKTNLLKWFEDKYAATHTMRLPEFTPPNFDSDEAGEDEYKVSLIDEMRRWCYINLGDCSFEITEDALILRWLPKEDVPINFRAEAREVVRKYLQFQSERGGGDNYAPCEIYHPTTGELLGASSFFIPLMAATELSQTASPR